MHKTNQRTALSDITSDKIYHKNIVEPPKKNGSENKK